VFLKDAILHILTFFYSKLFHTPMKTAFALLVTSFLAAVVVLQTMRMAAAASRRNFPAPSIPHILRRFQEHAADDAAALAQWYGAPLPHAATAADIVLAFQRLGIHVEGDDVAVVVSAIDLNNDQAVSLVDVAYGVAAAIQSWNSWKGKDRMWQLPTAAAVRRILKAGNISEVSVEGLKDAGILPHAKYPLQLMAAMVADGVLATLEEVVESWWGVIDANHNGRLDMNELMTVTGARWASKLGVTKAQALQHAHRCADELKLELHTWILQK
jgi:hypothetical protein